MYNINNIEQQEWDSCHLTPAIPNPHYVLFPTVLRVRLTSEWSAAETACLCWLQEHLNAVNLEQAPDFYLTTVKWDDLYLKFPVKIYRMGLLKKTKIWTEHGTYMQNFFSCSRDNLLFLTGTTCKTSRKPINQIYKKSLQNGPHIFQLNMIFSHKPTLKWTCRCKSQLQNWCL